MRDGSVMRCFTSEIPIPGSISIVKSLVADTVKYLIARHAFEADNSINDLNVIDLIYPNHQGTWRLVDRDLCFDFV